MEWVDGFESAALAPGQVKVVRHGREQIAVFRRDNGALIAVDNRCPHEGYPLSQGSVCGDELTCCYHNFKFDLRDGSCAKGEALTVHEVREADGRIAVGVVKPDPAAAIAARWSSWEEAMFEEREGQALRDAVRLLDLGVPPEEIAAAIARWDADRGPWGITHGAITAAEALEIAADGPESILALAVPMQQAMRSHTRRPARAVVEAETPGEDAANALLRRVESEDIAGCEALLRGMLDAGWGRAELEPLFFEMCAAHFLDFGHPAIYAAGLFDFLDRVGWTHAPSVLVGLLLNIVHGTREDLLPGWVRYRAFMAEQTAPSGFGDADAELGPIKPVADTLTALRDAIDAGASRTALCDWLVDRAAERVLWFDTDIDLRSDVQDNWLSVTHCLTFAHAVRTATERHAGAWPLLFQSARFTAHHRVLDGTALSWTPAEGPASAVVDAIRRGDESDAVGRAAWSFEHDRAALIAELRAFAQSDPVVRGIYAVHVMKTLEAVFREDRTLPVLAVVRFLAAPKRERATERRAREALAFVLDGKTPRLLAP